MCPREAFAAGCSIGAHATDETETECRGAASGHRGDPSKKYWHENYKRAFRYRVTLTNSAMPGSDREPAGARTTARWRGPCEYGDRDATSGPIRPYTETRRSGRRAPRDDARAACGRAPTARRPAGRVGRRTVGQGRARQREATPREGIARHRPAPGLSHPIKRHGSRQTGAAHTNTHTHTHATHTFATEPLRTGPRA